MALRDWLVALAVSGSALTALPAWAEEKGESGDASATDSDSSGTDGGSAKADEDAAKEPEEKTKKDGADKEASPAADAETSPVEEPGKTYRFVGARYRLIVVPQFMIGLFADGGTTVVNHSFGAEFGIRKDGFEYNLGLWFAGYGMDPTPFKAKSDGEEAWELVESKLNVLYLTADFLWSHPFSPQVALNYGMSAGLGIVFGQLLRNQAYKAPNGEYLPCAGPGNPQVPATGTGSQYCGNDNNHYNNYQEPGWGDGGSKPAIFPWIALQTGLRYKPHRRFVGRLDLGFGLSGFFFGLGADYGI